MKTRREIEVTLERAGAALAHRLRYPSMPDDTQDLLRAWDIAHGEWQQIEHLTVTPSPAEQPASLDAEYGELRAALAEKTTLAFERAFELEAVKKDCAQLVERVAQYNADLDTHEALIAAKNDEIAALVERVAVLEAAQVSDEKLQLIIEAVGQARSQQLSPTGIRLYLRRMMQAMKDATPHPHADEAAKVEAWQSMDSAPLDGTQVIVRYPLQGNAKRLASYQTLHKFWASGGEPFWPAQQGCEWAAIPPDVSPSSPAEGK